MDTLEELRDFIQNGDKYFMTDFLIVSVIFGYENRQLKALLIKDIESSWELPTGYIKRDEMLTSGAGRILKHRTGLDNVFLKQFHVFGDSPFRLTGHKTNSKVSVPEGNWLTERRLAIGFYALMDCSKAVVKHDLYIEDHKWIDIKEIPGNLLYDHNEVIYCALETLRHQVFNEPIGYNLLPEKFTLPELQSLYEIILDKKFNRGNFYTKLLNLKIITKLEEKRNIGQHRSPFLYEFHKENYLEVLNEKIIIAV